MKKIHEKIGFTLIEILIVVAIISVVAAITIPNMLRSKTTANDAAAKATLYVISDAAEAYALLHNGAYPTSISDLLNADPAYLSIDYTAAPKNGYNFTCTWSANDYSCTAKPIRNGTTGNAILTIASGAKKTTDVVSTIGDVACIVGTPGCGGGGNNTTNNPN